jgi:hypothetical protein
MEDSKETTIKKYRDTKLEQFKPIFLTRESYEFLRKAKKRDKKSMAQILDDLIKEKYGR